ncbi:hypothetical protein phi18_226 [Bacillus phage phi18]|nr:hypothetical protein phi18_029 [Bacillus phage phi18]UAV84496.1 hypothetical protein phi18_226 [Bacillus phage phi18]
MNGEIDMMNQVQVLREEYVEGYVVQMWRRNPSNAPVIEVFTEDNLEEGIIPEYVIANDDTFDRIVDAVEFGYLEELELV